MLEVPQKAGKFKVTFNATCSPPLKAVSWKDNKNTKEKRPKRTRLRNLRTEPPAKKEWSTYVMQEDHIKTWNNEHIIWK